MTDDYNKKIGVQKEVLEALPRNNAKNNKVYKEKVIELKEQYDNDLMLLSEEIIKRKNEYMNALPDKKIDEITISMNDIYNKLLIGNCFNSSYEKSGLDKLLYRLGHFYTDTHEDINKNIKTGVVSICLVAIIALVTLLIGIIAYRKKNNLS